MYKLILISLLLVGNFSLAAGRTDDSVGSDTAAKAPGETKCRCDSYAATDVPAGDRSPAKREQDNKAKIATVYSKDDATGGSSKAVQDSNGG